MANLERIKTFSKVSNIGERMMIQWYKNLTKMQKFWGWLFILSTVLFFASFTYFLNYNPSFPITPTNIFDFDEAQLSALVGMITSCVGSIVSVVGVVSTTILAWRREAREARDFQRERRQTQIEIEKMKLELEKLRRETEDRKNE